MKKILILNGPNINLTGLRELPELHTGVIAKEKMLSFVLNK